MLYKMNKQLSNHTNYNELIMNQLQLRACTFRPFDFHPIMKIENKINFRAPGLIPFEAKCKKQKSKLK